MALPKYILIRGDTYYVRRPLPLDVQTAFGGRKQVWRTLGTTSRKEAEAKAHAVLATIEAEIEAKRATLRAADEERAFLISEATNAALAAYGSAASGRVLSGLPFADLPNDASDEVRVAWQIRSGQAQARPSSRAEAVAHMDRAIADLEWEAANAAVPPLISEDGDGTLPERYRGALEARLRELIDADRRTLEAQKAVLTGANYTGDPGQTGTVGKVSLADLSAVWLSQKRPARSSQADMRTAIGRFDRVNGPLPYDAITDEHARRFKSDLLDDPKLKNATRAKLWGMLRALLNVAVDDGLLASNPFSQVKLRLDDDSSQREVLTQEDLTALFGKLDDPEEWWITRIALYTGARLGEICQLTKADFRTEAGVPYLHIREDAEAGKSVKTRNSIRRVPLHRRLITDGLLEWVKGRTSDALFSVGSAAASKRLLRRMRDAGLGEGKVFHSLRHTFKGVARRHMDAEWHDRLTGHAAKSVGQDYGDYDLRSLKKKIDLIAFGIEPPPLPALEAGAA